MKNCSHYILPMYLNKKKKSFVRKDYKIISNL